MVSLLASSSDSTSSASLSVLGSDRIVADFEPVDAGSDRTASESASDAANIARRDGTRGRRDESAARGAVSSSMGTLSV